MSKKFIVLLGVTVFLLGIAIRMAHYRWDFYNSDEAIVGVMGMHILSGEEYPIFNYGILYIGSMEAYIAAIMFKLFGISVLSHNLVVILFSIIYCFAMYFLAVRLFESKTIGFLTLVFTLICPSFLAFWNLQAIGGYMESLTFGTLIFILVHQIVWRDEKRIIFFLMLGLLTGAAWWTGGFVICYILPAIIFFFMKDKIFFLRRNFMILAGGFFFGSLPFWIYQFRTGFETMFLFSAEQGRFALQVLGDFVKYTLPLVLSAGSRALPGSSSFLCKLSYSLVVIFLASLIVLFWKYRRGFFSMMKLSTRGTKGPELIFCFAIIVILLYAFSRHGRLDIWRVLLPLYTAIPMLFAFLIVSLEKRMKSAAYITAGIVFFFSLYSNFCYCAEALEEGEKRRDRFGAPTVEKLTKHLINTGARMCYARDGLAFKIVVASRGEVICIPPYEGRYLPYEEIVNAEQKPVFILRANERSWFKNGLGSLCTFDMERHEDFVLFKNFKRPGEILFELSPQMWKAAASKNAGSAIFAYDRDISTRWTPQRSQKAGEYFKLDLGQVHKLRKLIIIIDSFEKRNYLEGIEFPLGFDLELSPDGKNWRKIFHLPDYGAVGSLFWSDCRPFWKAFDGRMELFLPEAEEARYIKLILTNDHHVYGWTINEIFVYSIGEDDGESRGSHEDVLDFLMKQEVKKVYADYWLSSWIYFASRKEIEYVPPYNPMRYPVWYEANRIVDFNEDIAFIVEKENAVSLEDFLKSSGIAYIREEIGKYLICYSLRQAIYDEGTKLGSDKWAAVTSNPGMDERNAFDGDPATRWGTGAPQRPGMFYQLDLGRNYILRRVSFSLGKFETDFPRGYDIEVSEDGENWEKLGEQDGWSGKVFWSGTHLLKYHDAPVIDFRCKPASARLIRISLRGDDDHFDFSIAEIDVWVKGDLL